LGTGSSQTRQGLGQDLGKARLAANQILASGDTILVEAVSRHGRRVASDDGEKKRCHEDAPIQP
jgi:hypothetical protein